MRISDWSSDVCSSDLKAEVQRKYQAIVGLANRVRVGNDWNYRNVMFCDDPGGTFQIPFDVLGRHRPNVHDLPIDVPSVADDAQGAGNFAIHCFEGRPDLCYFAYSACIGSAALAKPTQGAPT